MYVPDDHPRRPGYGDVFSVFILIMSIAIGLQAYSEIDRYSTLRTHGVTVEGYWAGRFTNPADGEPYGIYYFTADGRSYNAQQMLDERISYTASGDPVPVIYLPDDPNQSRIAGTEHFGMGSVVKLALCAVVAILALQYLIAYYTARPAWVLRVVSRWRRFRR